MRAVQAGTRIGHYEILTAIGSGGMGEVWKARDSRLRRNVAIKALPASLAADPARLTRLEREAQLLASLNHHHIATIHGLEEQDGTRFLVLELVDGQTLAERLLRGRIPVEEALALAEQLAQALEAAHDKGVIHRDLKPANIKITPDGCIKVLDFGIAKALATAVGADADTLTADPTRTGIVIGTPAYMSPEQARGEATDSRSDIWSFGAVLYEMLTGISPFRRKTTAETFVSVLESRLDFASLPPETPDVARRVLRRCLERDRARRLQHIADVRILLEDAANPGSAAPSRPISTQRYGGWLAAAAIAIVVGSALLWLLTHRGNPSPSPTFYLSVPFLERPAVPPYGQRPVALAADGATIAFAGRTRLWIRRLDQPDGLSVVTGPITNPFFSPDGEWIGFFSDSGLMKVSVRGGTPTTLASVTDRPAGAAWRADDTIVFATSEGLYEISAKAGERKLLGKPDRSRKESLYAWPQFLPGGRSLLLTVVSDETKEAPQTVTLDLNTLERKPLLVGTSARYVNGTVVYATESGLAAVAMEAGADRIVGKPMAISDVELSVAADNGAANFAVSGNGTLIFFNPPRPSDRLLEWIDRQGRHAPLAVEPQHYGYTIISPDGTRVAVERTTKGNRDIWILDLKRLTQTQLTDGPTEDMLPVWSADSTRVFFASRRGGNFDVYSQPADGSSGANLEFAGPEIQAPAAVPPNRSELIVYDRFQDLGLLNLSRPDRLEPLLHSSFDERLPDVSPDGRWMVYESDESGGQFEIVLRPFPDVTARRDVISTGGGRFPRWARDGVNEIYYVRPDGAMMAVPVTLSPSLVIGKGRKLFDWRKPPPGRSGQLYDVARDGRFLTTTLTEQAGESTQVSVLVNRLTSLTSSPPRAGR